MPRQFITNRALITYKNNKLFQPQKNLPILNKKLFYEQIFSMNEIFL